MGKLKVHELAKELGLESKQLIAKANEVGIEVTSHLSSLEEEQVNKIKEIFGKKENKGVKTQKNMEQEKNKEKKEKTTKKDATPVIIRREVILADEDKQEKKQEKTERKDVGFVERKNNKDFNIVYRKQQVKPMTVSELFGLKPNKKEEKVYQYQYDLIVDSPDSQFWQAVYASARKTAAQNDVLLEIMGPDRGTSYDKLDYMNMSIAAKADGIILQYNGEAGLEKAIDTAVENGIPVVTVMSDAVHSRRQSFVGVSDYQLGMAYGEIVSSYVDEDTEKILILQKRDIDDMNESQIYTQISNAVQAASGKNDIRIKGRNLLSTGTFETEEAVTDIFQQKRNIPDILVCMDEETTECARQAVLDFNLAGKVKIIGYYTSEDILAAVEKGVISVTCDVDATQLGQYSVEALTNYIKDGRTNSYYNVDINFLDRAAVEKMRREADTDEKASVE